MLRPFLLAAALVSALPAQAETLRRCGWHHNPTPGNVILEDADGQWWISRQGGAPVPGFESAYSSVFDDRVRIDYGGHLITDGASYGFSCACAEGEYGDGEVLSISNLTEIPMVRCESDPKLPNPVLSGQ